MTAQELDSAIQRLLDGKLPPEEHPALKAALEADPEALSLYLDCVELNLMLSARAHRASKNPFPSLVATTVRKQHRRALTLSLLSTAALFLILGIVLRLTLVPDKPPVLSYRSSPDTILTVKHSPVAENEPGPGTLAVGSRVTVEQGFLEFTFASGVSSIVQGPADLTFLDEDRLYLASGQAWFHVPKQAAGFQVHTPEMRVTDLGTEFAIISTENAGDEVHVLTGRVHVLNLNGLKREEILEAGHARIAGPAGRLKKTTLRQGEFLTTLPASLPHLHWSFDGDNPFQVAGTLDGVPSINTRPIQTNKRPKTERLVPGRNGNALNFDGSGDHVLTDWQGFEGRTPRTLACWIKLHPNEPKGWGSIAEWGFEQGPSNSYWRVRVTPSENRASARGVLRLGYGINWIDGETNVADGNWHHIAIVESEVSDSFDFPEVRFFVDGREEELTYLPRTKAVAPIETRPGEPLSMGRPLPEGTNFQGSIDELFIFEGTLSQASIHRLISTHHP